MYKSNNVIYSKDKTLFTNFNFIVFWEFTYSYLGTILSYSEYNKEVVNILTLLTNDIYPIIKKKEINQDDDRILVKNLIFKYKGNNCINNT